MLLTVRSQPISRQKWRLIARPSLDPPSVLLVDASAWLHASKSRPLLLREGLSQKRSHNSRPTDGHRPQLV